MALNFLEREELEAVRSRLKRAMASGVLTVDSHTQGRITYRSLAEMEIALGRLDAEMAVDEVGFVRTRRVVITGRSGF